MVERSQQRPKRPLEELEMLRLQKLALMPEKRSVNVHYFPFGSWISSGPK
jgi:hypothetical protein